MLIHSIDMILHNFSVKLLIQIKHLEISIIIEQSSTIFSANKERDWQLEQMEQLAFILI